MIQKLVIGLVLLVAALGAFLTLRRSAPPEVPFTRATRETIVSVLPTNGKVEPSEWVKVHAERPGRIVRLAVSRGESVRAGQLLATIESADAKVALDAAEARVAQLQAQADVLKRGGAAVELTDIENQLARHKAELAAARRELEITQRLEARKAATRAELTAAGELVEKIELQIQSLDRRRTALVADTDKASVEARLREARAAVEAARINLRQTEILCPIDGVVYELAARPGDYLVAGAPVASVGRLSEVRVGVFVDEPELGRVATGMPVTITWDALPGREWSGEVSQVATQIVPLGTRQVGEVVCRIANPGNALLPGTNVNAAIRSRVVKDSVTVPKEALNRQGNVTGVYRLDANNVLTWQPVGLGVSSVTRIQVVRGLKDGDAVTLPVDIPLKSGMSVKPVFPE